MGVSYTTAVGNPPVCTSLAFRAWVASLLAYRLAECPLYTGTIRYFSQSGNDSTGDGLDPWKFAITAGQATWTESSKTLTATGKFASYDHALATNQGTNVISVTGGTGVTVGVYTIASKVSADAITLTASIAAGHADLASGANITASPGPWKTISKANTYIGTWSSTSSGLRLRFERNGEWKENSGLALNKAYIAVDDYGTGHKPRFSRFAATYSSGGWALSSGQTYTYERADVNTVAWVREVAEVEDCLIKATSVADCEATIGSWYADGSKVYVHSRNNAVLPTNSAAVSYEAVYDNPTDCGIKITADACRAQNIRVDGYGIKAAGGIAEYGIHFDLAPAGSSCVVVGCEAYFNAAHNLGMAIDTHGQFTAVGCRAGWMGGLATTGTNFISYAAGNGHEAIFYDCTAVAGELPSNAISYTNNVQGGTAFYNHTAGGSNYTALFLAWNCRTIPHQWQTNGCNPANLTPWSDLVNCRAFIVGCQFRHRGTTAKDIAANVSIKFGNLGSQYASYINCVNEARQAWISTYSSSTSITSATLDSTFINCVFDVDMTAIPGMGLAGRYYSAATSGEVAQYYNCQFTIRTSSRATACLGGGGFDYAASGATVANSIIRIYSALSGRNALGINNSAAQIVNNAYIGMTQSQRSNSGYGWSADPYSMEQAGENYGEPTTVQNLVSTHQQQVRGYTLEYDFDWLKRGTTQTARGPWELFGPAQRTVDETQVEIDLDSGKAKILSGQTLAVLGQSQGGTAPAGGTTLRHIGCPGVE